jgi:hypothetical protein
MTSAAPQLMSANFFQVVAVCTACDKVLGPDHQMSQGLGNDPLGYQVHLKICFECRKTWNAKKQKKLEGKVTKMLREAQIKMKL